MLNNKSKKKIKRVGWIEKKGLVIKIVAKDARINQFLVVKGQGIRKIEVINKISEERNQLIF